MEGNFNTSFSKIESLAGNFGKGILQGLAAGFSVGAITGFTKEILNLADSLQNLSDQTGVSVELLSGLKSPLEEAGSSMDAFAKGVFNLQKNLGNVDKETDPAAQAIKRLGLNLNELRNAAPDVFIKQVTDAIAKIENPVERNTILFNLLGKSAKELGPAFQQLAGRFDEFRAKGLSAADVKALDDVGDALTRLKNQALVLGAEGVTGILRFFGALRDAPSVASKLDAATKQFAQRAGVAPERVEGMTSRDIISQAEQPTRFADPQAMRRSRDELLNLREEFNRLNSVNVTKPTAVFKGISDGAKKAKTDVNDVNNFIESLEKQLSSLEDKKLEITLGPDAAEIAKFDKQFEALKEKLGSKIKAFPGLEEFFVSLRDRIVANNQAVRELNASLEETIKRQQGLADEANEGVGIEGTSLTKDQVARQKAAQDQLDEMRNRLQIDTIDTRTPEGQERQRVSRIIADFEQAKKKIEEFGLQAGATNEETAATVELAWKKALDEINNKTDEVTEFQRRAMERAFDASTDILKDVLGGQIKSWEDFGLRVKKVIDEIAAEWLTLQLKNLVLGPDFGKQSAGGANIGGLLGQLLNKSSSTGGLPVGVGDRPAGVEGPVLPNGGFFSTGTNNAVATAITKAGTSILGLFGSALKFFGFHRGGLITPRGEYATFRAGLRMHSGGEVPIIAEAGEFMLNRMSAARLGRGNLEAMNRTGLLPGGGTTVNNNQKSVFVFPNAQFTDRKSVAQTQAALGRTVKKANRNL